MTSQGESIRPGDSNSESEEVPQFHSATALAPADAEAGVIEKAYSSVDDDKGTTPVITFPEGGARGWATAAGAAGVLFCTFGYINTFG